MTISNPSNQIVAFGNGATTVFSVPFVMDSASDIQVVFTDTDGSQTTLSQTTYSVNINPPVTGEIWGIGGTITYPLIGSPIASGTSLTISRILPLTQETSVSNQGDFAPLVIEAALDMLCMEIQQISGRTGRLRGTWVSGVAYSIGDVVKDGPAGLNSGNYYTCAIANTSGVWTTDLGNGDWSLSLPAVIPNTPFPLSIVNGGTGATSAVTALTNLGGIALSGNNAFTGNNTYAGSNDFTGGSVRVSTRGAADSSTFSASTAFVNSTALTLASGTTAVTQSSSDNTTKVATTAQVQSAVAANLQFTTQNIVTGSRSLSTVFQNTTGKSIMVSVVVTYNGNQQISALTDSANPPTTVVANFGLSSTSVATFSFIVLNNNFYEITPAGSATLNEWTEWR